MIHLVTTITSSNIRNKPYWAMANALEGSASRFGYNVHILSFFSEEYTLVARLRVFRDWLATNEGNAILLDCDTLVMDSLEPAFESNYDIGVCYRSHQIDALGFNHSCNMGVIYAPEGRRDKQLDFYDRWIKETEAVMGNGVKWFCEQHALNCMVGKPKVQRATSSYMAQKPYSQCHKRVSGIDILFMDGLVWNSPLRGNMFEVRLLHYCNIISGNMYHAWIPNFE